MDIEVLFNILLVIVILLAWYFVAKYILSTGVSSRYNETMPIFIGGIIVFLILILIVYVLLGGVNV